MLSHLLQMRGLKHVGSYGYLVTAKSHLLQMRGLKHITCRFLWLSGNVASFTDAWIETFASC